MAKKNKEEIPDYMVSLAAMQEIVNHWAMSGINKAKRTEESEEEKMITKLEKEIDKLKKERKDLKKTIRTLKKDCKKLEEENKELKEDYDRFDILDLDKK